MEFNSTERGSKLRGIYDQLEALKWINKYIHTFGGDKNSVTLSGFSAGGCSAALLALIASNPNNIECNFNYSCFVKSKIIYFKNILNI